MSQTNEVLEYKCPCCDAALVFGNDIQKMKCPYCDNEFDLETFATYNDGINTADETDFQWQEQNTAQWTEEETQSLHSFICSSCGGEIVSELTTAATFCPYCGNPTILPGRVSGGLKPDGVIPFKLGKEDVITAFQKLCKKKPLLPKFFTQQHQLEKITGIYVPFWLYDCDSHFHGNYKATRIHRWSDSQYNYTRTDHFYLMREASAQFSRIPMDASQKMDDAIMESIEPYDYSQIVDFDTAYLSGFFADKYDVEAKAGEERIHQRVNASMDSLISNSLIGYATCIPTSRRMQIQQGNANYVLLPVWMLYTKYQDKTYVFAMNGQTGKMTGTFPICPKRSAMWFSGIWAGVSALAGLIQFLL